MSGKLFGGPGSGFRRWIAGAILWGAVATGSALAQTSPYGPSTPAPVPVITPPPAAPTVGSPTQDGGIVQTGCSSCSGGLLGGHGPDLGPGGCSSCGGCGGPCYPGREPCDCCCDSDGRLGRLFCGFYQCICCPDPCYEPRWVALADAAFFQDAPRPITQMRLRYDSVWDYRFPDKAEILWARENQKGPRAPAGVAGERRVRYQDFSLYNEIAIEKFSVSFEMPYRNVEPDLFNGESGMGDLTIGTKSLLLDCELMQFAFQFKTYVPTGNFTKGIGNGHVSLEPALLLALKLTPRTYLQSEIAYWFPLGGTPDVQGPLFHYHFSLNHLLWNCGTGIKVVGVAELNGYEITGGAFTDPVTGALRSAKDVGDILNLGAGIRLVICDKIDFGVGSAFAVTTDSLGDEWVRAEFRWRF